MCVCIYICRGARLEGSQLLPAENSPGTGGLSWHPACFPGPCPAPLHATEVLVLCLQLYSVGVWKEAFTGI